MSFNVSGLNLLSGNIHGSSLRTTGLKSKAKEDSSIDPKMEKELRLLRQSEPSLSVREQYMKYTREGLMRSLVVDHASRVKENIVNNIIQPLEQFLTSGIDPNIRIADLSADEIEKLPPQFRDQVISINRSLNIDLNNPDADLSHLLEIVDLSKEEINSLRWERGQITPFIDPNITLFEVVSAITLDRFDSVISRSGVLPELDNQVFRDSNGAEFENLQLIRGELNNFFRSDVFNRPQVNNFEELLQFLSNATKALDEFATAQSKKVQETIRKRGELDVQFRPVVNKMV